MNELNSSKKESVFKVYKDKLNFFKPKSQNPTDPSPVNLTSDAPKIPTNPPATKPSVPNPNNITKDTIKPKTNIEPSTDKPSIDELLASEQKKAPSEKIYPETPPKPDIPLQKPTFSISLMLKYVAVLVAILILGYVVVNFNGLYKLTNYWYQTSIKHQKWADLHPIELVKAKTTAQKLDENYLYIPTLGIQAPIIWGVEEKDASNLLSDGLVQYIESSLPDEAVGNIYISGATSGPIWSGSLYKTVFTLLGNINPDSIITIIYNNKIYSYKIESVGFSSNKNVVISPGTNESDSYLNLLARFPVGINWHTLVVRAKLTKIESNISASIEDKVESLPENTSDIELGPIEVSPSPTSVPIPSSNNLPNPELLPDHFLPNL